MAYNSSIRLLAEPVRSIAAGAVAVGYMGIGTAFDHPVRIIMIQNLTDAVVMLSFDGIEDHIPLPANGFILLDITSNRTTNSGSFYISEGTRVYVKQVGVPTTGDVYVSVFYGKE